MPDRLTEIEAHHAAYCEAVRKNQMGLPFLEAILNAVGEISTTEAFDALCEDWGYVHAPADIAWLVAEVIRLRADLATAADLLRRGARNYADLDHDCR